MKRLRPGFELRSPIPFPTTININVHISKLNGDLQSIFQTCSKPNCPYKECVYFLWVADHFAVIVTLSVSAKISYMPIRVCRQTNVFFVYLFHVFMYLCDILIFCYFLFFSFPQICPVSVSQFWILMAKQNAGNHGHCQIPGQRTW